MEKCPECKGKGKLECGDQSEWVNTTQYYKCPLCYGSGEEPKYCPTCNRKRNLEAKVAELEAQLKAERESVNELSLHCQGLEARIR